jgi:uncharacterized protein YegP (UPF0339 family)
MTRRPSVEFYADARGEHRWRVLSNGRIMADSGEGYATRSNAKRAWNRLRVVVLAAKAVER